MVTARPAFVSRRINAYAPGYVANCWRKRIIGSRKDNLRTAFCPLWAVRYRGHGTLVHADSRRRVPLSATETRLGGRRCSRDSINNNFFAVDSGVFGPGIWIVGDSVFPWSGDHGIGIVGNSGRRANDPHVVGQNTAKSSSNSRKLTSNASSAIGIGR